MKKVEFVEEVEASLKTAEILNPENLLLMKYFFIKISLCILNVAFKEIDFTEDKVFKNIYSKKIDKLLEEYKRIKTELEKLITSKTAFGIAITLNHLNTPFDKF